MMHVHFHEVRRHERERDLNRRLELNRLRADGKTLAARIPENKRLFADPFRRTGHAARLLAVRAKCLAVGG